MISSSNLFNHCWTNFSSNDIEAKTITCGKITSVTTYLKFLAHWQHEQASSCHLHHQYRINAAPDIPNLVSNNKSERDNSRNGDRPVCHLHQLHACAHPREQSHAVLRHQSAGTSYQKYLITLSEKIS